MQFKTIMKDHGNSFKTMIAFSVGSEGSHSHIRWRESPCVGAAFKQDDPRAFKTFHSATPPQRICSNVEFSSLL